MILTKSIHIKPDGPQLIPNSASEGTLPPMKYLVKQQRYKRTNYGKIVWIKEKSEEF